MTWVAGVFGSHAEEFGGLGGESALFHRQVAYFELHASLLGEFADS